MSKRIDNLRQYLRVEGEGGRDLAQSRTLKITKSRISVGKATSSFKTPKRKSSTSKSGTRNQRRGKAYLSISINTSKKGERGNSRSQNMDQQWKKIKKKMNQTTSLVGKTGQGGYVGFLRRNSSSKTRNNGWSKKKSSLNRSQRGNGEEDQAVYNNLPFSQQYQYQQQQQKKRQQQQQQQKSPIRSQNRSTSISSKSKNLTSKSYLRPKYSSKKSKNSKDSSTIHHQRARGMKNRRSNSKRMSQSLDIQIDVPMNDRNNQLFLEAGEREIKSKIRRHNNLNRECVFAPNLSKGSNSKSINGISGSSQAKKRVNTFNPKTTDFFDRMTDFSKRKQRKIDIAKLQQRKNELYDDRTGQRLFKPRTNVLNHSNKSTKQSFSHQQYQQQQREFLQNGQHITSISSYNQNSLSQTPYQNERLESMPDYPHHNSGYSGVNYDSMILDPSSQKQQDDLGVGAESQPGKQDKVVEQYPEFEGEMEEHIQKVVQGKKQGILGTNSFKLFDEYTPLFLGPQNGVKSRSKSKKQKNMHHAASLKAKNFHFLEPENSEQQYNQDFQQLQQLQQQQQDVSTQNQEGDTFNFSFTQEEAESKERKLSCKSKKSKFLKSREILDKINSFSRQSKHSKVKRKGSKKPSSKTKPKKPAKKKSRQILEDKFEETSCLLFHLLDTKNLGYIGTQNVSVDDIPIQKLEIIASILFNLEEFDQQLDYPGFRRALKSLYKKLNPLLKHQLLFEPKVSKNIPQYSFEVVITSNFQPQLNKKSLNMAIPRRPYGNQSLYNYYTDEKKVRYLLDRITNQVNSNF